MSKLTNNELARKVDHLNNMMQVVIIVLLISFIGFTITVIDMAIDRYQSRIEATKDLNRGVEELNRNLRLIISPPPPIAIPTKTYSTTTP